MAKPANITGSLADTVHTAVAAAVVAAEAGSSDIGTGTRSAAVAAGARARGAKSRTATDTTLVEAEVGTASLPALDTRQNIVPVTTGVVDTNLASVAGGTRAADSVAVAGRMSTTVMAAVGVEEGRGWGWTVKRMWSWRTCPTRHKDRQKARKAAGRMAERGVEGVGTETEKRVETSIAVETER